MCPLFPFLIPAFEKGPYARGNAADGRFPEAGSKSFSPVNTIVQGELVGVISPQGADLPFPVPGGARLPHGVQCALPGLSAGGFLLQASPEPLQERAAGLFADSSGTVSLVCGFTPLRAVCSNGVQVHRGFSAVAGERKQQQQPQKKAEKRFPGHGSPPQVIPVGSYISIYPEKMKVSAHCLPRMHAAEGSERKRVLF